MVVTLPAVKKVNLPLVEAQGGIFKPRVYKKEI